MKLIVYWKRKGQQTADRWFWHDDLGTAFGRSIGVRSVATPVSKTRADEYLAHWSTSQISNHNYTIHAERA